MAQTGAPHVHVVVSARQGATPAQQCGTTCSARCAWQTNSLFYCGGRQGQPQPRQASEQQREEKLRRQAPPRCQPSSQIA
jgi:hypothetical protein